MKILLVDDDPLALEGIQRMLHWKPSAANWQAAPPAARRLWPCWRASAPTW